MPLANQNPSSSPAPFPYSSIAIQTQRNPSPLDPPSPLADRSFGEIILSKIVTGFLPRSFLAAPKNNINGGIGDGPRPEALSSTVRPPSQLPRREDDEDLYGRLKSLQEEVKRIQSVPLVIGQFMEMVDQNIGIAAVVDGDERESLTGFDVGHIGNFTIQAVSLVDERASG